MYPFILLFAILTLFQSIHTTPTTTLSTPSNPSDSNPNFLGVACYHLSHEETVSLHSCQQLFAHIFSGGDVYRKRGYWNGWIFKAPRPGGAEDRCVITIKSPVRGDRDVWMSRADIVLLASEVLEDCKTGGANTFEGAWSVIVTRDFVTQGNQRAVHTE